MKRGLAVPAILALLPSGCVSPLLDRLDLMNRQLATANAQIAETNQRLGSLQAKADEGNSRIDVIDQAILKFPGLKPSPESPPAAIPARPPVQAPPVPGPGGL